MSDTNEIEIPEAHAAILAANTFGVVSTLREKDGLISTNPVSYVWDGECVRISTIKGRVKFANLLANPMITFCVVDREDIMKYVEIRGHASMTDDPDRTFLRSTFEVGGMEMPENLDPPGTERVVIRIHPQRSSSPTLYGGRFHQSE